MSVLRLDRALNLVFWLLVVVLGYTAARRTSDFDWRSFWTVVSVSSVGYALGVTTWRCWQLRGVADDVYALEIHVVADPGEVQFSKKSSEGGDHRSGGP